MGLHHSKSAGKDPRVKPVGLVGINARRKEVSSNVLLRERRATAGPQVWPHLQENDPRWIVYFAYTTAVQTLNFRLKPMKSAWLAYQPRQTTSITASAVGCERHIHPY